MKTGCDGGEEQVHHAGADNDRREGLGRRDHRALVTRWRQGDRQKSKTATATDTRKSQNQEQLQKATPAED